MANALEAASLVMIPSGYENGTLGSLKPTDGTGDFTFSRGSDISATRVNEDGYIEKGYENLLLQSNSFTTSPWTSIIGSLTATSGQTGYDGSTDAWLLNSDVAGQSYVNQSVSQGGVQTFSVYLKKGTADFATILVRLTASYVIYIDLRDGSYLNPTFLFEDIDIENVGNDWWRVKLTYNASVSFIRIFVADALSSFDSAIGANIYIQDAMLNQGMVSYPYVETTTAPVAGGILEDMPRLDYSGSCPALLLEPQRTNLINYSEPFEASGTPNWRTQNGTIVLSNEKPYFLNTYAAKYVPSSTGFNQIFITIASLSVGSSYVNTYYLKPSSGIPYLFFEVGGRIKYNVSTNVLDPLPVGVSGGITQLQDGWLKATFIYDSVGSSINTNKVYASSTDDFTSGIPLDEYLLFTACQFEQGTYPTSYIPTYGTSQTRLRSSTPAIIDIPVVFGADDDFTIFTDSMSYVLGKMIFGGRPSQKTILWRQGPTSYTFRGDSNTTLSSWTTPIDFFNREKMIVKRESGVVSVFINGSPISVNPLNTSQSVTISSLGYGFNELGQYGFEGKINQLTAIPTALSDDECIELTTI